jgi:hypothetical protein
MALKFILHFMGNMHQPLHTSDNHDRGGNDVKIEVDGFPHSSRDVLIMNEGSLAPLGDVTGSTPGRKNCVNLVFASGSRKGALRQAR